MNWEAIGSVGEIIGALAVVFTIGYLAVQIRHARRALATDKSLVAAQIYVELMKRFAEGNERALSIRPLVKKDESGERLTDEELAEVFGFFIEATNLWVTIKSAGEMGRYDTAWVEAVRGKVSSQFSNSLGRTYLKTFPFRDPEMQGVVEEALLESNQDSDKVMEFQDALDQRRST